MIVRLSLIEKNCFTQNVVRRPASKVQRSQNGGNVGTRCGSDNTWQKLADSFSEGTF